MKLVLPVRGFLISLPFGALYGDDVRGPGWNYGGKRHEGVDFACPSGTPVSASAPGRVVYCGADSTGYGNLIKISHADGSETRYAHLSRFLTTKNAYVYGDQPIALSGASGNATGDHLHWEYRLADKKAVDPMRFLSAPAAGDVHETGGNVYETTENAIKIGDRVIVAAELVNVRDRAAGKPVGQLRRGTVVEALTDAEIASGLRWRKARAEFWIAEADSEGTKLLNKAEGEV